MRISIIVAAAENGVIGRGGQLPWRLSADLRRFKQLRWATRLSWAGEHGNRSVRPLPGRETIVVSRNADYRTDFSEVLIAEALMMRCKKQHKHRKTRRSSLAVRNFIGLRCRKRTDCISRALTPM